MNHYITFEKGELNSTITTLGYNLHKIADDLIYFKQFSKIYGVEHDAFGEIALRTINESIKVLKREFNLPIENNSCLESYSERHIDEVVKRANKDHYNPYNTTIPRLKELVRSFLAIAEREGKETNWEAIKNQCITML